MKKILYFLFAAILTVPSFSQKKDIRDVGSFSAIHVGESINVEIMQGNREEVVVETRGVDTEDVITEVSGDRLRIKMERGNWRNVSVNVSVTYKSLNEIGVSSAADLITNGVLKADELEVEVSSAGDANLEVDVRELEIRVSSAGDLTMKGKAKDQYIRVSSSGDYDAYDLISETAEVDASSSGDARVNVSEKLDAKASSSGSVYYKGKPSKVYADSSSGGRVRKS